MSQRDKQTEGRGGRIPDVAAQRRRNKGGQLRHNPEEPAEEGHPVSNGENESAIRPGPTATNNEERRTA
jgi:hypothetical protein